VPNLQAITPLGNKEPVTETYGPVTLTEITDIALASVSARLGREQDTAAALETFLGTPPPGAAEQCGNNLSAFWMGPDQWMIEAPFETHEDLAARLVGTSPNAYSVTEQTDAWCRFDLKGPSLPDLFERLCAADTHAFTGGEAVRTSIEHLGCFVLCRTQNHFSVIGPRSSAGSLYHALVTAFRSVF